MNLGDYFNTTEGGTVSQPTAGQFEPTRVGTGEFFAAPTQRITQAAAGASPDGLGRALGDVLSMSPLVRDLRHLRGRRSRRSMSGLGQNEVLVVEPAGPPTAWLVAAVLMGIAVRGAAGYVVGKAVAPSQQVESKYAWWGVPTAIIFGTLGLAVQSGIALSKR